MPTYTFENKKTGETYDDMMSISEKEAFLEKNPHIRQVIQPINIVGGIAGMTYKTDGGWKDNLSRIAEAHPNSPLADRYGKKSSKRIKTEQAVKKYKARKRNG